MGTTVRHLTMTELEAGLDEIRNAPKDGGLLQLIVRRPNVDQREILEEAELHPAEGLGRRQLEAAPQFSNCRSISASGDATQHHECSRDRAGGAGQRSLATGRGSALPRHGFECGELASRNATRNRLGDNRSNSAASHWMQQVRCPFWTRRHEVRKFSGRQRASSARHQRESDSARHDSSW